MGRILRHTLLEDDVYGIDLGFTKPGKLLIRNASTRDVRIGYDPYDVGALGVNYFTIEAGIAYVFDMGPGVGFVAQGQQMYFNSPDGDAEMEFWIADPR
jgi:hypothetical protein